jgi:putative sigma-54 modulation protein
VQVKLSARHGQLADDARTALAEKAEKLLHFFDRLTFIEVTVDLAKPEKQVEIVATAEHKHEFVARGESTDLTAAFNQALDKVKQQIKHYKERVQDHRGDPAANGGHRS